MAKEHESSSFCDASVGDERASAIAHWAAKHAKWPPYEKLGDFIELRNDDNLALHAVARSKFSNGDLILSEDALIRLPEVGQRTKLGLEQRYRSRAAFLFPALSVDWQTVSKDVKGALLSLFWAHPFVDTSSMTLRESYKACEDLLNYDAELSRTWNAETLMRYLHIVDLNIHKDDETKSKADFTGLFVLGSKFSHSCAPNCTWSFSKEGYLQYHAVRPIEPGDAFTFSYVGNGMNMVAGTLTRQRRLSSLWFICLCSRCQSPDLSRQFLCPKCREPTCIPDFEKYKKKEWSCQESVEHLVPEVQVWSCQSCQASFGPEAMPLMVEELLSSEVPKLMQGRPQDAQEDADKLLGLRRKAISEVGRRHWTWMLATFAWLQKCLVILNGFNLVEFTEKDVQSASTEVANWFEQFAPTMFEQRMSALSLTLKLMQSLGGSLQAWGYDPGDPLGDGVSIHSLAGRLGFSSSELDASLAGTN